MAVDGNTHPQSAVSQHPMTSAGSSARLADAPSPDDPRKPRSPRRLRVGAWKYSAQKAAREFIRDQCMDSAAALTYHSVLSIFPGLLAVFSILNLAGAQKTVAKFVSTTVTQIAPGASSSSIRDAIEHLTSQPAAGVGAVLGVVIALWTASGYVRAFTRASNRVYEIDEGRPIWKLLPVQLGITLILLALVLIMLGILALSGPVVQQLGAAVGAAPALVVTWSIVKWPLLAIAIIVMIAVLFYATPNVRQPRFRWVSLGSALAFILIIIASAAFALYVANFSHYNKAYGSLAGVVILLIWLWIVNLALLFGAEFDAELERSRELQAGIAAEEDIQLPPRDTRASVKAARQEEKEIEEGREVRMTHGERAAAPQHSGKIR